MTSIVFPCNVDGLVISGLKSNPPLSPNLICPAHDTPSMSARIIRKTPEGWICSLDRDHIVFVPR